MALALRDSVTKLNNVGPKRAQKLRLLGIYTIGDLIAHYPREYEDRSIISKIAEIEEGQSCTIQAKFAEEPQNSGFRGKSMIVTRAKILDDSGVMEALWFNQAYLKSSFKMGRDYLFTGKISEKNGKLQMVSPDYEIYSGEMLHSGRIVPIYPSTYKLTQKQLRAYIKDALAAADFITEILPGDFVKTFGFPGKRDAVNAIHFPKTNEDFFLGRKRLVFEELLLMQSALFYLKGVSREEQTDVAIARRDVGEIGFPFSLTAAQEAVIDEIVGDISSGQVMYRLVQGDVGSGKTAVAQAICYMACKSGYQAVLMAPTEVLANQHYAGFCSLFEPLGIDVVLLSGGLPAKEKRDALNRIASGAAGMVIGTHALIQDSVEFLNLGLVITDEQHRFGVRQRLKLSDKGLNPHVLVMSATPIPRTLAMVLYGDLDISVLHGMPPGRQPIDTFHVTPEYRERLYGFIRKEMESGRQAYVICPVIEDNETNSVKSVLSYGEEIAKRYLKGARVQYLHGKMKAGEKQAVMEEFCSGNLDVIVSTTVIEVGVNVPNATVIVIENAEKFGLSQLHQLRGRVGRGGHKSYCILVSDTKSSTGKKRLKAMADTTDGFALSELDLKLRGPGDFFGTRQHGLPELKIANLYKDLSELQMAQEVARDLFRSGRIYSPQWQPFMKAVRSYMDGPLAL